jgi:hypothetical protein
MRSLDDLFDTMPSPIQPLNTWSDRDKDIAMAVAINHLKYTDDMEELVEVFLESLCCEDDSMSSGILLVNCREGNKRFEDYYKAQMVSLYRKLESIINDRIDYYNAS